MSPTRSKKPLAFGTFFLPRYSWNVIPVLIFCSIFCIQDNNGALFVLPSQLNGAEYTSHETPGFAGGFFGLFSSEVEVDQRSNKSAQRHPYIIYQLDLSQVSCRYLVFVYEEIVGRFVLFYDRFFFDVEPYCIFNEATDAS